ncbi:MAG: hypothetical protein R3F34_11705 [Planctomycetota bacterium]
MSTGRAVLALVVALAAANVPRGSVVVDAVPRCADAERQVLHAARAEEAVEVSRGRERLRARLGAVEAFRAVRSEHAGSGNVGARSALAACKHLTTLGLDGEAWLEADAAVRLARTDAILLDAHLERAHAARRSEEWEHALDDYRWCAARTAGERRVEALLRAGEASAELGFVEQARTLWTDAVLDPTPCTETVEVYDRLARDCLERGDPEGAAGWLGACERALHDELVCITPTGTSLRRALIGMRARFELQCLASEAAVRHAPNVDDRDD